MKRLYIKPTMETVQLNVHQPMLTMSLTETESPIQYSRELDPSSEPLDVLLPADSFPEKNP